MTTDDPQAITLAKEIELAQADDVNRLTKLGHAIDLLNHHISVYGFRPNGDAEGWKENADAMSAVPDEIATHLNRALANAAKYAARAFEQEDRA